MTSHSLRCLLEPASVAVVGASERPGAVGGTLMQRLIGNARERGLALMEGKY